MVWPTRWPSSFRPYPRAPTGRGAPARCRGFSTTTSPSFVLATRSTTRAEWDARDCGASHKPSIAFLNVARGMQLQSGTFASFWAILRKSLSPMPISLKDEGNPKDLSKAMYSSIPSRVVFSGQYAGQSRTVRQILDGRGGPITYPVRVQEVALRNASRPHSSP